MVVNSRSVVIGFLIAIGSVAVVVVSLLRRDPIAGHGAMQPDRNGGASSGNTSEQSEASAFTAVAPAATKTRGALLFDDLASVARCFEQAFPPSEDGISYRGFQVCEPSARLIIPPGSHLEILEKHQPEYAARVKVLNGPAKGEIGFVHEAWITPSPWSRDR
jgi:hypothetical protein